MQSVTDHKARKDLQSLPSFFFSTDETQEIASSTVRRIFDCCLTVVALCKHRRALFDKIDSCSFLAAELTHKSGYN